jgi:HEAT repeat protein
MIRAKDSKSKLQLLALAKKQRLIKVHFVLAVDQNIEASRAFIVLGGTARDAVPALMKIYDENISVQSQSAVEDALAWIGPSASPAVSLLLRAATNSNPRLRANALWALGDIHAEPQLCVPTLIRALGDTNDLVRLSAAHALGMFGAEAQSAVSSLAELANVAPRPARPGHYLGVDVLLEARNALRKIDPAPVWPSSETLPELSLPTADPALFPR